MSGETFYYSELDYYANIAWEKVRNIPQNGFLFFDVDTTAIVPRNNKQSIRKDFHDLYTRVYTCREDLDIVAITYRSRSSGISELSDYRFWHVVFNEDIQSIIQDTSQFQLQGLIVDALGSLSVKIEDYEKITQRILTDPVYKMQFLIAVFADQIPYTFLIDDGLDGKLAAELGIGLKSEFYGEE